MDKPWWLAGGIAPSAVIAAYQPYGAASYAASKSNLANPGTSDATDGAAYPTWGADTGWVFASASSQYLNVGSGALLSEHPITIIGLFKTSTTAAQSIASICRTSTSDNRFHLYVYVATKTSVAAQINDGATSGGVATTATYTPGAWSTGFAVFTSSTSRTAYVNGADGVLGETSTTPSGVNATYIGARHNSTALGTFMNGNIGAVAFYNAALTSTQVGNLHTAMLALVA